MQVRGFSGFTKKKLGLSGEPPNVARPYALVTLIKTQPSHGFGDCVYVATGVLHYQGSNIAKRHAALRCAQC